MRVLLTGATGFAGGHILRALLNANINVRAPLRGAASARPLSPLLETPRIDDLATANWNELCNGVDAVVHAAAYAHDDRADPAKIFRINRDATAALVQAAAHHHARFIFLSSIRAQVGVSSPIPLKDGYPPQPDGPYGEAKLAAEAAINQACPNNISLRLAPLYGPGVKANLATLFKLAQTCLPLPFGALRAKRSLLSVQTLSDLIVRLLQEDPDLRGTFLVAEPGALSIGEMIATLRAGAGRPPRLISVPAPWIKAACFALNKPLLWARLGEPLVVSDTLALERRYPAVFRPSSEGLTQWAKADQAD
ncbi:NAD-dependent epimerase/dehydratase family protein [Rhizobiales bacterium TNE-4]|nr:NAD-dependent epimerase/dehydratase family protein [Rhizobiales bacterium TNE-4]MBV1827573.1 NAD-dependent epimerase/dehydratase family protein [Rhizobiales bacterium TNE-4]